MKRERFAALRRTCLVWAIVGVAAVLIVSHSGSLDLTGGAVLAQEEGGGGGGRGAGPRPNPLMPPERELAMKIRGTFTWAGAGDVIIRHPFAQNADPAFQSLIKHLKDADVSVANMEGAVVDYAAFDEPLGNGQPKALLADLKAMGIDMVNTANNHTFDAGEPGVFETIKNLDEAGIAHAGSGRNLQAARSPAFFNSPKGVIGMVGIFSIGFPEFQPRFVPNIEEAANPGEFLTSGASYQSGAQGGQPGLNPLHVTPMYTVTPEQMAFLRKWRDDVYSHREEVPGGVPAAPANESKELLYGATGQWYKTGGKTGEIFYKMNNRDLAEILRAVRNGKQYSDFMIVQIHCHQNNYTYQQYGFDHEAPDFLVELAHKAIDNGADVFMAHGVHTLRPVEIYKGKPIFYGVNEFAWQLPQASIPANPGGPNTDAENTFRPGSEMDRLNKPENLEGLLPVVQYKDGKVEEIRLYPTDLGQGQPRVFSRRGIPMTPSPDMAKRVLEKLQKISQPVGTKITIENGVGIIRPTS